MSTPPYNIKADLQQINKFVTFEEGDRKLYMDHCDRIVKYVINKLKENDVVFEQLSNGHIFQGSYADNLKIKRSDEYDIVLRLKLPVLDKVKVLSYNGYYDASKAGFVLINIDKVFESLQDKLWEQRNLGMNTKTLQALTDKLNEMSDEDGYGYLIQNEISNWFESMFRKIFPNGCLKNLRINGKRYEIKHKTSGPVQTLTVSNPGIKKISINLVPGFVFEKSHWVALKDYSNYLCTDWLAISKPDERNNETFMASFCEMERTLIHDKNGLKNTLRLLKKLRDRQNIQSVTSYHIKTIFLFEAEKQKENPKFWNKSPAFLLKRMLTKLIDAVEYGELPFFWDEDHNMFSDFSDYDKAAISGQLRSLQECISKVENKQWGNNKLYEIFLDKDEISSMNRGETLSNFDNRKSRKKSKKKSHKRKNRWKRMTEANSYRDERYLEYLYADHYDFEEMTVVNSNRNEDKSNSLTNLAIKAILIACAGIFIYKFFRPTKI